jgi:hypothetical protein
MLDAALALGEVERDLGRASGRARLAMVEREARAGGYRVAAQHAAAALR